MKRLPYLIAAILLIASCQSGDTGEAPLTQTDTTSATEPVKTYPPEKGCTFSMNKIMSAGAGRHIAVTGVKHCDDGRVFQEVTLYAPGEPINSKKANVYIVPDTLHPLAVSWSGDTLVITHHTPTTTPTLQQFMVDSIPVVYAVEAAKEAI